FAVFHFQSCAQSRALNRFIKQRVKQSTQNPSLRKSMKKPSFLLLVATIAAALSITTSAHAGNPAPKRTPVPPKHTTIASISADSITVMEANSTSKTYKITDDTVIEFKGQKAKATDLQPGMRVSVTAGSDQTKAARISANEAPKEPTKPA